jgi:hypothetical protein
MLLKTLAQVEPARRKAGHRRQMQAAFVGLRDMFRALILPPAMHKP